MSVQDRDPSHTRQQSEAERAQLAAFIAITTQPINNALQIARIAHEASMKRARECVKCWADRIAEQVCKATD